MTESVAELVCDEATPTSPTSSPNRHETPSDDVVDPPSYDTLSDSPPPYSSSLNVADRIFSIPEAPPDYFSVVATRLQDARRDSNDLSGFCIKAFRTIFVAFAVLMILMVLIAIPVAMLAIGIGYLGDCPIEPMVPVYLILAGICGIIKSIEALLKQVMVCSKASSLQNCLRKWKKHPKLKYFLLLWHLADLVFNLMLLGLFIAGSYWVFHVYDDLKGAGFPVEECDPVLYKISFGVMISVYIMLVLTCCCVCGCALCRIRGNEDDRLTPPTTTRLRRPVMEEEEGEREEEEGESGHDETMFSNVIQSNEFYEETTEINDDLTSVDLSVGGDYD